MAPGCVMTLYDEDDKDVEKRGERLVVDNRRGNGLLVERDLGDLDEDVEAFDCVCLRPGRGACANVRFPANVDCIVFDGENCSLDDWDESRKYMGSGRSSSGTGIISSLLGGGSSSSSNSNLKTEESFSLLKGFSNRHYKNKIRSVAVRKGAELIVYDDSDFSDDAYSFRADGNSNLYVNLADHPDPAVRSLDKDIESLQCKKLGFRGK